ncbi:Integrase, catalytic core [Cucumis melo var. makuwa]|uniref:Integrase, catalytic core n=1 Tax=Cucumis melo var. makuwa TaxID=1194695 RepID=A0A5D3CJB7_CUCMM|nr:Integrase, catalytic core [Cucumis melo var. makuwa]
MCGDKKAFFELDESFRNTVKFGDNSIALVLEKVQQATSRSFSNRKVMESKETIGVSAFRFDKSEAFIAFRSFKVQVEKEIGSSIKVLCTDRGREYISREFETFFENNGIKRQLNAAYTPQQNGVSVNWSIHILNRSPTLAVQNMIPEEAWSGWRLKVAERQVSTNFDGIDDDESQKPTKRDQLGSIDGPVNPPSFSTTSDNEERPQRTKRKPAWMTDYEVTGINESDDLLTYFALFSDCDPRIFEEVIKDPKWQRAMDEEIEAIERNNT